MEQLLLPSFHDIFASDDPGHRAARRRFSSVTPERFTAALQRALQLEHLSFTSYALMIALRNRPGMSVTELGEVSRMSYKAVSKQIERTPWFEKGRGKSGAVNLHLSPAASSTLSNIEARLSQA